MDRTRKNDLHKLDVYRCALELYRQIGAIVARFPHGEAEQTPAEIVAAQDLADRESAMLTKLIRSV